LAWKVGDKVGIRPIPAQQQSRIDGDTPADDERIPKFTVCLEA